MQPKKYKYPFASQGEYNSIPDEPEIVGEGKASFAEGFPPELSQPFSQSGKAVRRLDFNGIFNDITKFQIYQQNGGMFSWDAESDFEPPCMIYDDLAKNFYKCMKPNGPSVNKIIRPSDDAGEEYWQELAGGKKLADALAAKASLVHSHPTSQLTGLSKFVDDKCTVGAKHFSSSASKVMSYGRNVEFTISADRDAYGRLTSLGVSTTNCTDTDTDTDVDVDTDTDGGY